MNAYLGWTGAWDSRLQSGFRIFRKQSQLGISMPRGTFLMQDVHPDSICWPYFGVYMSGDAFFNFPGSSQSRGGVLSFTDGHVEWHRWTDNRTIVAYSPDYHRHNDASAGNEDILWLRDRTTIR